MILQGPRVFPRPLGLFEPPTTLDTILSQPHKRNNPLSIPTPDVPNRLQENPIHLIQHIRMLLRIPHRFIDRLKRHHRTLTGEFRTDLRPQGGEFGGYGGNVVGGHVL